MSTGISYQDFVKTSNLMARRQGYHRRPIVICWASVLSTVTLISTILYQAQMDDD